MAKQKEWQIALKLMRDYAMKKQYQACRDFGVPAKKYKDNTANALTASIVDFLNYSGGSVSRINSTGIMRKINGQMKWTKSTQRKGTADIVGVKDGRYLAIEVKIGKDRMSDHQIKEKARIERSGGLYFIARDMDEFFEWYCRQFGIPELINN